MNKPAGLFDRLTQALPFFGLLVVAIFAIRRVDDFDTWWHLASGRWIAQHHSIPQTDVLSFTVPQNEWINLQWLYDLLLYWVYLIGGANGLVIVSAACFVATFAILARHMGRFVGPVAVTLLVCWVGMTVNERFLVRPEMASFPLLAAVQLLLTKGREDTRYLRWLVPVMLLWANMHSLFILGIGAIVCAIAGAFVAELPLMPSSWRRDSGWPADARKQLLVWGGAAMAATLVNPYLLRAILFPIELMSRIDGSSPVYGSIGEFKPPFSGYFLTFALGSYQAFVFFAAAVAVLAAGLRATDPPPRPGRVEQGRIDIGAIVFALILGYLSLLARRNVGIFAIGAVPAVAACLGVLLGRLPKALSSAALVNGAVVALLAGTLVVSGLVVSNRWYASTGETHEFGFGIIESNFHIRATEFFREQKLPGPLYNDMTSGGYLTWDNPTGKGVYVDGRLEVYDTPFFGAYLSNMGNFAAWKKDADARGLQSVIVFHRWGNRHGLMRALVSTQEWRLIYFDETVASFMRVKGNEAAAENAREAFAKTWRPRTEELLASPSRNFDWQWSIGRYTGQLAYARVLETFGDNKNAVRWFEETLKTGVPGTFEIEIRQRLAQHLASQGQLAQARVHLERALAIDANEETTRGMLARLDALSR